MDERKVKTFAWLSVASGLVGASALNYVRVTRRERKKREEIQSNMEKEIQAIHVAGARVDERIRAGAYDGPEILQNVLVDFRFEQIVEMEKE